MDQPTCGKGLAAHSVLPAKLVELTAAVAQILELHTKALDLRDENAREEYESELIALLNARLVQDRGMLSGM